MRQPAPLSTAPPAPMFSLLFGTAFSSNEANGMRSPLGCKAALRRNKCSKRQRLLRVLRHFVRHDFCLKYEHRNRNRHGWRNDGGHCCAQLRPAGWMLSTQVVSISWRWQMAKHILSCLRAFVSTSSAAGSYCRSYPLVLLRWARHGLLMELHGVKEERLPLILVGCPTQSTSKKIIKTTWKGIWLKLGLTMTSHERFQWFCFLAGCRTDSLTTKGWKPLVGFSGSTYGNSVEDEGDISDQRCTRSPLR